MAKTYSNDKTIDRSLKHSLRDGAYFSVMTGSGESYFTAFAVFLKASTAQVGFLASVPPLLASFSQLFSAWLGRRTRKRKPVILAGALLQAFSWVPIALLPYWFPQYAIPLLTASIVLYYASGNLVMPQWSSLMGDLVEERKRGRYFARRTRIASLSSFTALLLAGVVLHYFDKLDMTASGYGLIFAVAFVARLASAFHLMQMYDPPGQVAVLESPVQQDNWQWLKSSQFLRFSLFFSLMNFSVAIASPFFSLYLLRDLQFTYMEFMLCTAVTVLAQFLALNYWGRICDVFGSRVVLGISTSLIPLIPLLWLFSNNLYYLLVTQALSGLIWAGFHLSANNFLYELIPVQRRVTMLAFHNIAGSVGLFFGALLGGALGALAPQSWQIFGMEIHWLSVLYNLFLLSFVVRLLMVVYFLPRIKEVIPQCPLRMRRLIFRVSRFNPLTGIIFDVIGSRIPEAGSDKRAVSKAIFGK